MTEIGKRIKIPREQIVFKTSRSSGPGGQNVNKVSSRVTVLFDVANCKYFTSGQKELILIRMAGRADKNGLIRVVSQRHRTQGANRRAAVERLVELLGEALTSRPIRKETEPTIAAKKRRLEKKKRRSSLKKERAKIFSLIGWGD